MESEQWKLEQDLCRCCHSEGTYNHLGSSWFNQIDEEERYSDMLLEHLGLSITPVEGVLAEVTYTICEPCIQRLKEATNFRRQVLSCEAKFQDLCSRNVFTVNNPFEVKLEYDAEEDSCGDDFKNDDDDGFNMDLNFSDEDGTKSINKQTVKKAKGKGKAPVKSKQVKKKVGKSKIITDEVPASESNTNESDEPAVKTKGRGSTKLRLKEQEDYTIDANEYVCKRCNKRYDKLCSLKFHIKTKHFKIPRFVCPICQQTFMTPAPLVLHKLELHNIDDRHKCNACKGIFNTKVQLRKHMNNFHMMGERYKCDFCEYESFSFEGMYKHKFKHKTVKDFHCRFCRKSFLRKTTLDLHERIHTGDRRKVCTVCGQAFVQKASLNYHMAKYHPEVNF